jgi:hypothetical protein
LVLCSVMKACPFILPSVISRTSNLHQERHTSQINVTICK